MHTEIMIHMPDFPYRMSI